MCLVSLYILKIDNRYDIFIMYMTKSEQNCYALSCHQQNTTVENERMRIICLKLFQIIIFKSLNLSLKHSEYSYYIKYKMEYRETKEQSNSISDSHHKDSSYYNIQLLNQMFACQLEPTSTKLTCKALQFIRKIILYVKLFQTLESKIGVPEIVTTVEECRGVVKGIYKQKFSNLELLFSKFDKKLLTQTIKKLLKLKGINHKMVSPEVQQKYCQKDQKKTCGKSPKHYQPPFLTQPSPSSTVPSQPFQCLGCLRFISQSWDLFPSINPSSRINYLFQNYKVFENQQLITQDICALFNNGGGYLFIVGNENIQKLKYGQEKICGFFIQENQKDKYRVFFDRCKKYLQPGVADEDIEISFLPFYGGLRNEFIKKWVIRVKVFPNRPEIMRYVSYKLNNSQKRIQAEFFSLNQEGDVEYLDFQQVYQKVHLKHKTRRNFISPVNFHKNIKCYTPLKSQSVSPPSVQPSFPTSLKPSTSFSSSKPALKLKHTLLVITSKFTKQTLQRIQQFKQNLIKNKILYTIENLTFPNKKVNLWIVSYDCLSQIIEGILKVYNKNGEYTFCRVKRVIKITDNEFLRDFKDQVLMTDFGKLRVELGEVGKPQVEIFNSPDNTINRELRQPTFMRFKTSRDAILCYGLLYSNTHKIEFIELKY